MYRNSILSPRSDFFKLYQRSFLDQLLDLVNCYYSFSSQFFPMSFRAKRLEDEVLPLRGLHIVQQSVFILYLILLGCLL